MQIVRPKLAQTRHPCENDHMSMFDLGKAMEGLIKSNHYSEGQVLPILPAEKLLASHQHQAMLMHMQSLSRLNPEQFEYHYLDLIHRFANMVQLLPIREGAYLGSLLNMSLSRALNALLELDNLANANQCDFLETAIVSNQALLYFAVFSSALLLDLFRVISQQRVILCDQEGYYVADWNPLLGSMDAHSNATSYRLYPISGVYSRVEYSLLLLLLENVLNIDSYAWLSSHSDVFVDWLHALLNELHIDGKIVEILKIIKLLQDRESAFLDQLPPADIDAEDPAATKDAVDFTKWLRESIQQGTLDVNNARAGVFRVKEGVFLDFSVLGTEFVKVFGKEMPMFTVFQQFGNLFGITKKSGHDFAFDQFFSTHMDLQPAQKHGRSFSLAKKQNHVKDGVLLKDPYLVFKNGQLPTVDQKLQAVKINESSNRLFTKEKATKHFEAKGK